MKDVIIYQDEWEHRIQPDCLSLRYMETGVKYYNPTRHFWMLASEKLGKDATPSQYDVVYLPDVAGYLLKER